MKRSLAICAATLVLAAATTLAACSSQKLPAEQALASIQSTLDAARDEAAKYYPEKLAAADEELKTLKASLASGDYAGVLGEAPKLTVEVGALANGVKLKAAEVKKALDDSWTSLATSVPEAMQAVQVKIDALKKSHKLPSGVDTAAASSAWDKAKGAFASGNVQEAVTAATDAMSQLQAAAAKLKMTLPAATTAAQ